jgi:hypothetical protein
MTAAALRARCTAMRFCGKLSEPLEYLLPDNGVIPELQS